MVSNPLETGIGAVMILTAVPVYVVFVAWEDKPSERKQTHFCVNKSFSRVHQRFHEQVDGHDAKVDVGGASQQGSLSGNKNIFSILLLIRKYKYIYIKSKHTIKFLTFPLCVYWYALHNGDIHVD